MESPRILEIRGGWMAVGVGCGVAGPTREEALARYREARARHTVILTRPTNERAPPSERSPTDAQD